MIRSIFISSAEPYSGKSLVTLGILEAILRRTPKVAFFKPVIRNPKKKGDLDKNIDLILTRYGLDQTYNESFAFYRKDVQSLLGKGKHDEFIDQVLKQYKELEEKNDFVICEGSDYIGEGSFFEFDINALIVKSLGLPTIIIGQGNGRVLTEIFNPVQMAIESLQDQETKIIGVIIKRVKEERV